MNTGEEITKNPLPEESRPVRATAAELEARVEYTAMMLIDGRRKSEVKRFFKDNYGLSGRQAERYLRLARDRLVQETEKTRRELIAESFGFYMRVLHNPDASTGEQLSARQKADELMGLQAPKTVIEAQVQVDDMLDIWVDNLSPDQKDAINDAALYAEQVEARNRTEAQLAREDEYRTLTVELDDTDGIEDDDDSVRAED